MKTRLSRILYLIAVIAWVLLLWPNPVTVFLAACFSCLTLPIYKRLRIISGRWRLKIERKTHFRGKHLAMSLVSKMPWISYALFIVLSFLLPFAALALLVSPQAVAGLDRLRELRAANFQIPPDWVEYFNSIRAHLAEYPRVDKIINDGLANLDSWVTDAVGILVSRSFGFVGSTMNVLWLTFLFLTLTIVFTVYGRRIRKIVGRAFNIPVNILAGFLQAIHKGLKAIILGIAFVALIQGFCCGLGFAVAGVNQPAFWGMLATMVAPIPAVGTALVWFPLCISLWFSGKTVAAVGLAIWGGVFISAIDNVLRPFFLRRGIKANFFVLILVMLCGMNMFGAVGLIAGPIFLAIAIQAIELANRNFKKSP